MQKMVKGNQLHQTMFTMINLFDDLPDEEHEGTGEENEIGPSLFFHLKSVGHSTLLEVEIDLGVDDADHKQRNDKLERSGEDCVP